MKKNIKQYHCIYILYPNICWVFFRLLAHLYVIHVEWFLIDFLAHVCTCTLSILQLYSFECLPQNIDVQFNKSHVIFSGFITLWLQWLFFLFSCFDNTNFHDSNNALVSDAPKRANTILIIYLFQLSTAKSI